MKFYITSGLWKLFTSKHLKSLAKKNLSENMHALFREGITKKICSIFYA